jgi:hypothetical protein
VRAGGRAPVLCGGQGEEAAKMAVGGELMMATRAERAEQHINWKRRRKWPSI